MMSDKFRDSPYMSLSENSIPPNEADLLYPESGKIEIVNDNNSLDFLDSFSIMERRFEFSDRPYMGVPVSG